jgi:hypothetical protein
MMDIVQKAIEYVECRRCGAKPKEPCKTKGGEPYEGSWFAHQIRKDPFEDEFRRGWKEAAEAYRPRVDP